MRRRRGFTLVEVLVAAGVILIVSVGLLESVGYARRSGAALRHRAAAAAEAVAVMEEALALGYDGLPTGVTRTAKALDGGAVTCSVTRTVTLESSAGVPLKQVRVQVSWSEALLPGRPTLTVELDSYASNRVPL